MNIDPGLIVVIVAVLIFYLRLIIMQRERARRVAHIQAQASKKTKKGKAAPATPPGFSVLSKNRTDLAIAGVGVLAILSGVALNANLLKLAVLQPYWWLPTAAGIIAFSWAFKL